MPARRRLSIIAASPRVVVSGMPAAVLTDQGLVAGLRLHCAARQAAAVSRRSGSSGATRVMANGVPLLINPCVAICQSVEQIPGGPPVITSSADQGDRHMSRLALSLSIATSGRSATVDAAATRTCARCSSC